MLSADVRGCNPLKVNGAVVHTTWDFGLLGYFLLFIFHIMQQRAKVPELAGTQVRNMVSDKLYPPPHHGLRKNAK